jgi:hypothetical protein
MSLKLEDTDSFKLLLKQSDISKDKLLKLIDDEVAHNIDYVFNYEEYKKLVRYSPLVQSTIIDYKDIKNFILKNSKTSYLMIESINRASSDFGKDNMYSITYLTISFDHNIPGLERFVTERKRNLKIENILNGN